MGGRTRERQEPKCLRSPVHGGPASGIAGTARGAGGAPRMTGPTHRALIPGETIRGSRIGRSPRGCTSRARRRWSAATTQAMPSRRCGPWSTNCSGRRSCAAPRPCRSVVAAHPGSHPTECQPSADPRRTGAGVNGALRYQPRGSQPAPTAAEDSVALFLSPTLKPGAGAPGKRVHLPFIQHTWKIPPPGDAQATNALPCSHFMVAIVPFVRR